MPHHSGTDFEVLRLAISQLRAERHAQQQQQQQQQLDYQAELSINPHKSFLPNRTGSGHTTPLFGQRGPTELVQHSPGKNAVAATLELIHSTLQPEPGEVERREVGAEGRRRGAGEPGVQRYGAPVRVVGSLGGNWDPSNSDTYTPSSNQRPGNQTDLTNDGREKADQQREPAFPKAAKHGAASSSTTACPVEGDRTRSVNCNWLLVFLLFSL